MTSVSVSDGRASVTVSIPLCHFLHCADAPPRPVGVDDDAEEWTHLRLPPLRAERCQEPHVILWQRQSALVGVTSSPTEQHVQPTGPAPLRRPESRPRTVLRPGSEHPHSPSALRRNPRRSSGKSYRSIRKRPRVLRAPWCSPASWGSMTAINSKVVGLPKFLLSYCGRSLLLVAARRSRTSISEIARP